MRALVVEERAPDYGGCVLKEVETPAPGPGEVRVRVKAAAGNYPDLLQTRGEYQHKPPLPFIPGMELAGEVEALGADVAGFAVGDAVVGGARIGGFSEFAVTPARGLRRKPERLSFSEAAGYATAYLTAYVALVRRARAQLPVCGKRPFRLENASASQANAPVAQLDSALPSEGKGRTFESCRVRQRSSPGGPSLRAPQGP